MLAQRLARRLCAECAQPLMNGDDELQLAQQLNISSQRLFTGKGCASCVGIGMKGRVGIFELLDPSQELRQLIMNKVAYQQLLAQASADGLTTLWSEGLRKALQGLISLKEVLRVIN